MAEDVPKQNSLIFTMKKSWWIAESVKLNFKLKVILKNIRNKNHGTWKRKKWPEIHEQILNNWFQNSLFNQEINQKDRFKWISFHKYNNFYVFSRIYPLKYPHKKWKKKLNNNGGKEYQTFISSCPDNSTQNKLDKTLMSIF